MPVGGPYGNTIQFNRVDTLFTSPVTGDVTLSLYNQSAYPGPNNSMSIDNVSIAAVPEPTTTAGMLVGATALFGVALRRRQQQD